MTGIVDDLGRALVTIRLKQPDAEDFIEVDTWVDTGFTGELVLPKSIVESLGLTDANVIKAELGDGTEAVFDTYICALEWFGEQIEIEALQSSGDYPLLGATLLMGHQLAIDYALSSVTIA